MNAIKTIVIDDEPHARETLKSMFSDYVRNVEVVAEAGSAAEAFDKINKYKPDVIFVDVEMPMGTGFDLLGMYEKPSFKVVFVTGFDRYALNAIKFSAIDYLLKPVNIEELRRAVEKVQTTISLPSDNAELENFVTVIKNPRKQSNKLAVTVNNGFELLAVETITHCEADLSYTKIHLSSGKTIVSSYNIGEYEDMLAEYNFFRVHTSFVVNRNHILRYIKGEGGTIILSSQLELPVSRRRKAGFLEWMGV